MMPEEKCRPYFRQIVSAFEYLHKNHICHRDIKLDNILIESGTNQIKVIDFGFTAFTSNQNGEKQKLKIFCGTPSYMAPELVKKSEYDGAKVDMWALGVLLYTLLLGCFPFKGNSEQELYSRIMRGWYKFPSGALLSKEAKHIITKCIQIDS